MVSPKLYSFFQYFFGSCPVCAQSCRRCTLIFLKIAYNIRVFHLRASYLPDDRTLVVFFLLPDDTLPFGTDVSVAPFFRYFGHLSPALSACWYCGVFFDGPSCCFVVSFACSVTSELSILTVDVATDGCSAGKDCILSLLIVGFLGLSAWYYFLCL